MKRIYLVAFLILLAVGIPIFNLWSAAVTRAKFLKIRDGGIALTVAQVEALVGRPARIEQSQTADQTVTGEVYHYPIHDGDMKVTFVNGIVFKAEFIPGAQS